MGALYKLTGKLNGLANLTVMAVLENTSLVFIPKLKEFGEKLNVKDFTYTDVHGEADIEHAELFALAMIEEGKRFDNSEELINEASRLTMNLLNKIFK